MALHEVHGAASLKKRKPRFEVRVKRTRRQIVRIKDDAAICTFERDATDETIQDWINFLHWEKDKLIGWDDFSRRNRSRLTWRSGLREYRRETERPEIDAIDWRAPGETPVPQKPRQDPDELGSEDEDYS